MLFIIKPLDSRITFKDMTDCDCALMCQLDRYTCKRTDIPAPVIFHMKDHEVKEDLENAANVVNQVQWMVFILVQSMAVHWVPEQRGRGGLKMLIFWEPRHKAGKLTMCLLSLEILFFRHPFCPSHALLFFPTVKKKYNLASVHSRVPKLFFYEALATILKYIICTDYAQASRHTF